jgi:hypothetical protein
MACNCRVKDIFEDYMTARRMNWVLSLLLACIIKMPVLGQGYTTATKPPNPAKTGLQPLASFSFMQLYGGIIIIKAAFDSLPDSLNFILDTGSGGISLDSLTADELGIATTESNRTIRGIAGIKKVRFAYNHSLRLPGLVVDSLDFHINDYEMLSGVYGVKIDGIIGYSFFRRYIVGINFDTKTIQVFPSGPYKYPKGGYLMRPAIASLPMQFARLHDNRPFSARYYIDTGAGLCLLLSQMVVKDSALFGAQKKIYHTIAEGIGGKAEMGVTIIKKFRIGHYNFRNMPVYIFGDTYNVTSYPFLAGLIGNDLLRRFNMVVNYGKSEIHLTPNASYKEPFDYTYTGFNMYQEEGTVYVTDVMPGSPAAKVGLQEGDVIVALGNKFAGDLQDYKNLIKDPGSKLKILFSRNNVLSEVKLEIGSIKSRK